MAFFSSGRSCRRFSIGVERDWRARFKKRFRNRVGIAFALHLVGAGLYDVGATHVLFQQTFIVMSMFEVQKNLHALSMRLIHRAQNMIAVVPIDVQKFRSAATQERQIGGIKRIEQGMFASLPQMAAT